MEVAAEQVPYAAAGGGEGGGTSAVPATMPMDGGRWVDADVEGPQPHGFAAGFTTWYLERMEAGTPMLLEARDDTATRQGDGPTEYDGAVQPAAAGMEVERSTDGRGGADRDAAGATAVGSTDTTTAGAGVVGMAVEGPGVATVTKRRRKPQKRTRKNHGGTQRHRRDHEGSRREGGDVGGARGGRATPTP